jgi:hypothetical protein
MGFGTNRDYKTTNDRAKRNLKVLAILTKSYRDSGMAQEESEQCAWKEFNTLSTSKLKRIAAKGSL